MKPVDQTSFGEPDGNCYAACIASILELPVEAVPILCKEPDWRERTRDFLAGFGLDVLILQFPADPGDWAWMPDCYHIMAGTSDRGLRHAVVGRAGRMVHDPHPDKTGLVGCADELDFFVALDPSVLAARAEAEALAK
jgi:hypothetical protein